MKEDELKFHNLDEKYHSLYHAISFKVSSDTQVVLSKVDALKDKIEGLEKKIDTIDKDLKTGQQKQHETEKDIIRLQNDKVSYNVFNDKNREVSTLINGIINDKAKITGGWKVIAILGCIATFVLGAGNLVLNYIKTIGQQEVMIEKYKKED
ncbi:MAG: hypothetical protein ACRC5T_11230 [Cetobacterium sp.]